MEHVMATIGFTGITWQLAIDCLIKDGWELRTECYSEDGGDFDTAYWRAKRIVNGQVVELVAENPIELLGLSVIGNRWGNKWLEADIPDHEADIQDFEVTYNSETHEETRKRVE